MLQQGPDLDFQLEAAQAGGWCMNRSQPVKIPTHTPSSRDGVRRRRATLRHLVENVASEDGLSPLSCRTVEFPGFSGGAAGGVCEPPRTAQDLTLRGGCVV